MFLLVSPKFVLCFEKYLNAKTFKPVQFIGKECLELKMKRVVSIDNLRECIEFYIKRVHLYLAETIYMHIQHS